MSTISAVVTKVIDVRRHQRRWVVRVEVLSLAGLGETVFLCDTEKDARQIKRGASLMIREDVFS